MNKKGLIDIVVVLILTISIFEGCIELEASPSTVVKDFARQWEKGNYDQCYELMSNNFKSKVDETTFIQLMKDCQMELWPNKYYKFEEVSSENISNNTASVEFTYYKKSPYYIDDLITKPPIQHKEIELVKEEDGWKLTNLHCELNTRKYR